MPTSRPLAELSTHQALSQEIDEQAVENIVRTYGFSIVARRWLAAWVDIAVLPLFFVVPALVLGDTLYQSVLPLWLFLAVAYFPVSEGIFGRSLGKLVTGLRVVTSEGNVPGINRAILRTLPRVVEVNPFFVGGLPAGLLVLFTGKRQRLGDMLAGTVVLREHDVVKLHQSRAT